MANQKTTLTASNIKYLLTIYNLSGNDNGVRCVQIAQKLKISKPSVYTMINTLKDMGIVKKNLYDKVFFTDEGLQIAVRYNGYYNVISNLLKSCITDENDILCASCAVLAEVSEKGLSLFREKEKDMVKKNV